MPATRSSTVVRAVSSSPHDDDVALDGVVEIGERGGGDVLERGDDVGLGCGLLHRPGRSSPRRGTIGWNSRPCFVEAVGHRDRRPCPRAASAWSATVATAASHWTPITTSSAAAASALVPGRSPATRSPQRSRSSSTTSGPGARSRGPHVTRDRPPPAGSRSPVPPARSPQHPDVHVRELRTPLCGSPTPEVCAFVGFHVATNCHALNSDITVYSGRGSIVVMNDVPTPSLDVCSRCLP